MIQDTFSALFEPIHIGSAQVDHRIVLAPLTRMRAADDHVPTEMMLDYYNQRASLPGTLLITEATAIAARAGGLGNGPGIWSDEQVAGWKRIVDSIHNKGCIIYCQLWAPGRSADAAELRRDVPNADVVSSGTIAREGYETPRPLTRVEIDEYVDFFVNAARNAVFGAGFDGVEIHGANGYLIDQFIKSTINNRTDEYGVTIDGRLRFPLRVVDAVVAAVGAQRTSIRLSPWERFANSFMPDPIPTFSQLVSELSMRDLAYLHLIEPRASSMTATGVLYNPPEPGVEPKAKHSSESLDFACRLWTPRPVILAGGFTPETALRRVQEGKAGGENIMVAFGRYFISNPDLPLRIRSKTPLTRYDRSTFYSVKQSLGYTDYPFS